MAASRFTTLNLSRLAPLLLVACYGRKEPADLVIRSASIFTASLTDSGTVTRGSVAIRDGRIIYVGSDSGAGGLVGPHTETIEGTGGLVVPGFVDSHVHPSGGVELMECDLSRDSTAAQAIATVRRCAEERPSAAWVRGTGWQLPIFSQGNPTAAQLDRAVSDRPAFITAADGHSAWVNSRAIALAGLDTSVVDPPNGRIERDTRGAPSGTLRESAMQLVSRLLPSYSAADYVAGFTRAFELASSFGITAIIDANADSTMLEAYRSMDSMGTLPVRVTAAQDLGVRPAVGQVERVKRLRDYFHGRLVTANSAKIFMDGVIEARTAALLTPYIDRKDYRGEPSLVQASLDSLVGELDKAGVQIHIHAIGDRAIRMSLDAYEKVKTYAGAGERRHQIAHLELVDPADIPRFRSIGIIANFQPLWAYDDPYIVDLTIPVLGPTRSRWLYPIQSLLATGATVVGGSDWPVSSMNPLEAIQVGITRRAPDAGPGNGWIPEERAGLRAMLRAYTICGAFGRFAESTTGSIEVGKLADLVLLDGNLFELPPHDIAKARVMVTIMDGRIRYRRPTQ